MFMLFLADNLGGGSAIRQLVTDTLTGGQGIEDLAQTLGPSGTAIGTTMTDIFANFTASVTLDHGTQAEFGLDNIDMYETCGNHLFRSQPPLCSHTHGGRSQSGPPHEQERGGAPVRLLNISLRPDVWTTHPVEPDAFQGFTSDCNLGWLGSFIPLRLPGGGVQVVSYSLGPLPASDARRVESLRDMS